MSKPEIEAIYPLSPLQEGMLFHTQFGHGANPYVVQISYSLRGADPAALRRAWQSVVERHAALRSAFVWKKRDRPLQVVHRRVELPWREEDLRALPPEERRARLARAVEDDRAQGFDLARAPLMRVSLFRTGDAEHEMVWTNHHLLSDGWSTGIIVGEVLAQHEALSRGQALRLPPVRPYGDYIAWLGKQDTAGAEAFWRRTLAGFASPTPLAVDRRLMPGEDDAERDHAEATVRLDAAAAGALLRVGREHGLTPGSLVQGAWALLLSRYSGERDVVFGTTVSGRPAELEGVERMVGSFINTIPVRALVDPAAPAGEWLRGFQAQQAEARQYEHTPLVMAHGWSEVPRGTPLFDSLVVFENAMPGAPKLAERTPGALEVRGARAVERTNYPLTLTAAVAGDEVMLRLAYDPLRFDETAVRRMLGHLCTLLRGIAAAPATPIAQLPMVTPPEREELISAWNPAPRPFPAEKCIHHLLEEQAERTPDAVAVEWDGGRMTFAELDSRATRLARHLRRIGVGPEVKAGILTERSPEMIVGIFGILKAGGAYVPLDHTHPADRIGYTLQDSGAKVLLTQERLVDGLPEHACTVVRLDADWPVIQQEPAERIETGVTSENLAYVYYTSGSTGRPKGVLMHHRGVVNYIDWGCEYYGAASGSGSPVFSSIAVDLTLTNFLPLFVGKRIVLVPEGPGVDALAELLKSKPGFSHIKITPTHLSLLNPLLTAEEASAAANTLVIGADNLRAEPTLFWQDEARSVRLLNEYGPTETVVGCAIYDVSAGAPRSGAVSIGRAIDNLTWYVLDERMQPVPAGVPGELYIGGVGVARGYLNRPGLTAEKFIPDPFSAEPGARFYRTGDRARWLAGGQMEFLGRTDFQVKIRGYRVETGEIESVLMSHPRVSKALAVIREDIPGDPRLVGYVVPVQGAEAPGVAELRALLKERVPEYMVPSAFVYLTEDQVPTSGKISFKALPAPTGDRADDDDYVAPATPTEQVMAGIWAEVLGAPQVGAGDSFFELGGHSLLATRVVSRVRDALGVELPLRVLFRTPVLRDLARWADQARQSASAVLPAVGGVARPENVPLSFAQERLWYLDQLEPESSLYNVASAWRMAGALDVDALEAALGEIVRRHEALRTTLPTVDGEPVQVVADATPVDLDVEDLSHLPAVEREDEARRRVRDEAAAPFDLARGPLLRLRLLRLADDDHLLLATLHHAVTDGWSMALFARELTALYAAFAAGQPSPLPELPVQYADYAVWQRTQLQGEALDAQLAWWKTKMAGAPGLLELPTDRPRPPVQSHRGARERLAFSPELAERLRLLSRREGATMYMTLLGAFKVLLSRYAGQQDVVVGTSIAGRTRAELEGLIGLFFNTLVLRTDLSGDPTFRELLGRVRETTLGAYDHQDVPFEKLVDALQPERTLRYTPLFQVLFELHNTPRASTRLSGLALRGVDAEIGTAKTDLTLAMVEGPDGIRGEIEYSTDLFDASTIRRLIGHYEVLLEAIAADPAARVSTLPLLTSVERGAMQGWNPAPRPFPADKCIHHLLEEQAARTPDAVAVDWQDGRMTFAELDAHANRLARHLRRIGVGPEVKAGILTERSPEMIVGIFGILKAGGAYVPLDHTHPADRIGYTLRDSGAKVLLTQERLVDGLPEHACTLVRLDADWPVIQQEPADRIETGVTSENLAYVYYTSGSTGRPKGVLMHHRGVVNYIDWGCEYYGAASGSGSPVFSSIAVDLTLTNFLPLFVGKRIVLVPEGPGVDALAELLKSKPGFSHIKITPTHLSLLNPLLTAEEASAAANTLVIGADNLRAEPTLFWQDEARSVRLLNEYGPTETVVGCAIYDVSAGAPRSGAVSIGRAIDNLTWYVLDERMQPVPAGVPGELYIGGVGVARGYLNRPGLTAEKFIPDPFSAEPGARFYRTGDRARWLEGGQMEFLGRTDFQVKIRGYRVETGEIESVLMSHPRISKALAIIREDVPGDPRLVGYVVPAQGEEAPSVAELRALLRERVPEYMIPGAFVYLTEADVPTTGKISPAQLPAPSGERVGMRDYVAPRDHVELQLAQLWEEMLGVSPVGVTDNFFEVGGNSLLAVRLLGRVRQRFAVQLPLVTLVTGATIEAVAELVRGQSAAQAAPASPLVALQPRGDRPPLFCIHPAGGNLVGYVNLVRHLPADQPVYGLQDPLHHLGGISAQPVEVLAETYLRAIRAVQPHGPYRLLGWSFGGTVAYEMARQLRAGGESVALLGIMDTLAPVFGDVFADTDETSAKVMAGLARESASVRGQEMDLVAEELYPLDEEARYAYVLRRLKDAGLAHPDAGPEIVQAQMRMWWTRTRQGNAYAPGPYEGTITLFRASEIDREAQQDFPYLLQLNLEQRALGWDRLAAGSIDVHMIPGTHATMGSEPNVRALAEQLSECLARAAAPHEQDAGV